MDEVPAVRARVERLLGARVVAAHRPAGGFTSAGRWVVRLEDGTSAFVKIGTTADTATWVRNEHRWCSLIHADFVPEVLAFDDGSPPVVVFEDLSRGHWPPPWRDGDAERVVETLGRVAATAVAGEVPALYDHWDRTAGWRAVGDDPHPMLSIRLCSPEWLEAALPTLVEAEAAAPLAGGALLHFDVRSDNLCLLDDRVVLVDWNMPVRGNAVFDLAAFAPSLRLEGGPLPEEIVPDQAELAASIAGYFCARAGLPPIADAPRVRWIQERQARIALPWAARALGLPPPDGDYARHAIGRLDEQLARGEFDEPRWHELVEEVLVDAYLASDDPRAQSGKFDDEAEWRWSRELTLDALPPSAAGRRVHLLDVGCANGYLMESLARWGAERGVVVEPYGLDISPRLVALAQRRLPAWRDRIWADNALAWDPPRRFDVVNLGLDAAPPGRERELIDRAMGWLAPGGRLTLRPDRVTEGGTTAVEQLRALGLEPDGILHAPSRDGTALRQTAYLDHRPA
ncbi:MAG TPA: class I SAM-dependent methyltransferase [Nitriliruptorales bacterium]